MGGCFSLESYCTLVHPHNLSILVTIFIAHFPSANVPAGPFVTSPALPMVNTTVQFASGTTPPSVDVTIMLQNDNIALEGTERVVLDVVNIDSDSGIVVGGSDPSTNMEVFPQTNISILDDDRTSV